MSNAAVTPRAPETLALRFVWRCALIDASNCRNVAVRVGGAQVVGEVIDRLKEHLRGGVERYFIGQNGWIVHIC